MTSTSLSRSAILEKGAAALGTLSDFLQGTYALVQFIAGDKGLKLVCCQSVRKPLSRVHDQHIRPGNIEVLISAINGYYYLMSQARI